MLSGIDIGCGETKVTMEGVNFIGVDIRPDIPNLDVCCNVTLLPFRDYSFDRVVSSHVLEHFPRAHWKNILAEWLRIVAQDGQIWLKLPNIIWAARRIVEDKIIDGNVLNVLYGAQENPFDFHYNGLTPEIVAQALDERGFELIHYSETGYNMFLGAQRRIAQTQAQSQAQPN